MRAASNGKEVPLSARLINLAEEERKHLARELHDDIGQRLSLLAVNLDVLRNEPGFEDALREKLHCILSELQELAADVHNLSHRLHSSKLQHLGLPVALKELCRQLAGQHHVNIDLQSDEAAARLPEDVALCFYRVAQEALNNAVKHSHSKRVQVHLDQNSARVRLQVRDFGVGFDQATSVAGLGLATMQERLNMIGGTLSISSIAGKGTQLRAESLAQGGRLVLTSQESRNNPSSSQTPSSAALSAAKTSTQRARAAHESSRCQQQRLHDIVQEMKVARARSRELLCKTLALVRIDSKSSKSA